MYQVEVETQDGRIYEFGPPRAKLAHHHFTAQTLENMFKLWEASGFKEQNLPDAVRHYEGCEVYARQENERWLLDSDDQWELVTC